VNDKSVTGYEFHTKTYYTFVSYVSTAGLFHKGQGKKAEMHKRTAPGHIKIPKRIHTTAAGISAEQQKGKKEVQGSGTGGAPPDKPAAEKTAP
jgi:hypothetical protein